MPWYITMGYSAHKDIKQLDPKYECYDALILFEASERDAILLRLKYNTVRLEEYNNKDRALYEFDLAARIYKRQ